MPNRSSDVVVAFRDVVKDFHLIHRRPTSFKRMVINFPGFLREWREAGTFWVLDGVSFEVRRGETFGICGHNGSGKSTTHGVSRPRASRAGVMRSLWGRGLDTGRKKPWKNRRGGRMIVGMPSQLERIAINPKICHGRPCVRGTRIMVWLVVQYLANGDSVEDILTAYPSLAREDVQACLAYAAELTRERVLPIEVSS